MTVSKTVGWGFDSLRPCQKKGIDMVSPAEFVSQVKRELQRVTWPSSKETVAMTVAVIVMSVLAMVYFFVSDAVIVYCLSKILGV